MQHQGCYVIQIAGAQAGLFLCRAVSGCSAHLSHAQRQRADHGGGGLAPYLPWSVSGRKGMAVCALPVELSENASGGVLSVQNLSRGAVAKVPALGETGSL